MSSIYQLTTEAKQLASILSEGELTEDIENALEINQNELQKKAIDYGYVMKSFESDIDAIDEEIKRLQALKSVRKNGIDRMKSALLEAMQVYDIQKVETPTMKISIRNNPESVELVNEYQVPDKFRKQKVTETIDKTGIKNALKNGEEVPGAVLVRNQSIQIK